MTELQDTLERNRRRSFAAAAQPNCNRAFRAAALANRAAGWYADAQHAASFVLDRSLPDDLRLRLNAHGKYLRYWASCLAQEAALA